jgi:RimJ/RimL family protein N-acetyltransferase
MQIRQTDDEETIRKIVTHDAVWTHVTDDFSVKEDYKPPIGGVIWLEVLDGGSLGAYMFHPHNFVTYEIHTCLFPAARGAKAMQACAMAFDWIFANTPCRKIITQVPKNNHLALSYAKRCGLVVEGVNRQSFMKNGQLLDQTNLGITKEEFLCQ